MSLDDVRAHLRTRDKNELIDLLMERAIDDDRLRRRLLMNAAKKGAKGPNLATYRAAIDEAVDPDGFVDYREAYDYTSGIEEAIDSIEQLLKEGHASEVIELAEHALKAVEDAIGSVDDSDGQVGTILERLQDLHHKACTKARPDPEALGRRLFEWELRSDYDVFFGAAQIYAAVLGQKGLTVYRHLAEREWAKVPVLGPDRDDADKYGRRFRLTHIMETLAQQSGDVEALVAVKRRDLSTAYSYLQIAEVYKQAGQKDLALEWAERGVRAFPQRTDSRLREFLAVEYERRHRHDEAMVLIWTDFEESPVLERYRQLKTHATRAGQWPLWRDRALELLREAIAKTKADRSNDRWRWLPLADHSELVRIFLWERDADAAWREACDGGCTDSLWLELAAKQEQKHPEDVLPVYQKQVERTLNRKNNDAYRDAIGLLRKIHELLVSLGRESDFAGYVESVRIAHKPKRNFVKLLDHAKWH